jgi:hypothetical protein
VTEKGGNNRCGREIARGEREDREHLPINGGMNLSAGGGGIMTNNGTRRGANPGCFNQFGFNPGHDGGRSYGEDM